MKGLWLTWRSVPPTESRASPIINLSVGKGNHIHNRRFIRRVFSLGLLLISFSTADFIYYLAIQQRFPSVCRK
jgi:hypothetical protein